MIDLTALNQHVQELLESTKVIQNELLEKQEMLKKVYINSYKQKKIIEAYRKKYGDLGMNAGEN